MKKYIMALDAGTTSSRCILFDIGGKIVSMAQREFPQIFPREGWVEHDPMDIWSTEAAVAAEAVLKIGARWDEIYAIGITNQRQTTVVWDRKSGQPICNAIVWQCRRTADICEALAKDGKEEFIKERTGLLLDPYFSATKLQWILENIDGAREKAEAGELCFGTVDSWLIWKLTGGRVHATDYSNAARTMLFNIHTLEWDEELLSLFGVPRSMLPRVMPSASLFGYTDAALFGAEIAIGGVLGDQQAALFGQCCHSVGEVKNTYGTGGFLLMNTGERPYMTANGLITTVAWGIGDEVTYALEGSVFTSGAAIQWLRDGLGIIDTAPESESLAASVPDSDGVMVVPAFSGMGAPWWDPYARGMIIGITRATTRAHIARATLESLAYQTADVIDLMQRSLGEKITALRVDGGASANSLMLNFQADILGVPLHRPACIETTALGAAYMAGLSLGVYSSLAQIRENHKIECEITPKASPEWREEKIRVWRRAVERSLGWIE
ncbi:MAG: glycerol kinase GlpK [Clostridia bacterium]|nr:glycerol kinase GlpK [Clostridia bacterium]